MKNKQFRQKSSIQKLYHLRRNGRKYVDWSLNRYDRDEISRHFPVTPILYEIPTKCFHDVKFSSHLVKELHYSYKAGKKSIVRSLNENSIAKLQSLGIPFKVIKYRIDLCK